MLAFTLPLQSSVFATHLYKASPCDKAELQMLHCLKIAKAASFTVDLATNLTNLQSPLQQHYKTRKYEICLTTN